MFFVSAERMCLPVLFKEIATDLNLSLVQVGTVWGMDPLAGVFVSLFSGLLIDRFGAKRTVTVITLFTGLLGSLRGLATDFISLASFMFLFGLIVATTPTVLPKVVALWFKDRHLGLASGIISTAGSLGGMAASLMSAMVLSPLLGALDIDLIEVMDREGRVFLRVQDPFLYGDQPPLTSYVRGLLKGIRDLPSYGVEKRGGRSYREGIRHL